MNRYASTADLTMRQRQAGTGATDTRLLFLCGHRSFAGKYLYGTGMQRVPLRCQACEDARGKR